MVKSPKKGAGGYAKTYFYMKPIFLLGLTGTLIILTLHQPQEIWQILTLPFPSLSCVGKNSSKACVMSIRGDFQVWDLTYVGSISPSKWPGVKNSRGPRIRSRLISSTFPLAWISSTISPTQCVPEKKKKKKKQK